MGWRYADRERSLLRRRPVGLELTGLLGAGRKGEKSPRCPSAQRARYNITRNTSDLPRKQPNSRYRFRHLPKLTASDTKSRV